VYTDGGVAWGASYKRPAKKGLHILYKFHIQHHHSVLKYIKQVRGLALNSAFEIKPPRPALSGSFSGSYKNLFFHFHFLFYRRGSYSTCGGPSSIPQRLISLSSSSSKSPNWRSTANSRSKARRRSRIRRKRISARAPRRRSRATARSITLLS